MSDTSKLPVEETYQPKEGYLSLRYPESRCASIACQLVWHKKWDRVLKWNPPFAQWFVRGTLHASENAVDIRAKSWHKYKVACLWEGELASIRTITYRELYGEANKPASVLQNLGLRKGDTVAICTPLVLEFPILE